MHFAKDYRPFKLKSPLDISENVENLRNLYRMANDMAAKESIDSSHLDHIIDSLIEFLKLHQTNDVIREKVIELVTIFQRAIQIKAKIFQRLKRILLMIRVLKTIPNGTLNRIHEQFVCLERFTSCFNLDMVAKKLASPRVCIHFIYVRSCSNKRSFH